VLDSIGRITMQYGVTAADFVLEVNAESALTG
jgi:hypothetical protein